MCLCGGRLSGRAVGHRTVSAGFGARGLLEPLRRRAHASAHGAHAEDRQAAAELRRPDAGSSNYRLSCAPPSAKRRAARCATVASGRHGRHRHSRACWQVSRAVPPTMIDDVISAAPCRKPKAGMNMARIAALRAGLPDYVPGVTINRFCRSGLQSIAMAAERIRSGSAEIIIAGGAESMSMVPVGGTPLRARIRGSSRIGPRSTSAWDSPRRTSAAQVRHLARRADAFSLRSHQNALRRAGRPASSTMRSFRSKRRTPTVVTEAVTKTAFMFDKDEGPRADTTARSAGEVEAGVSREGHR